MERHGHGLHVIWNRLMLDDQSPSIQFDFLYDSGRQEGLHRRRLIALLTCGRQKAGENRQSQHLKNPEPRAFCLEPVVGQGKWRRRGKSHHSTLNFELESSTFNMD